MGHTESSPPGTTSVERVEVERPHPLDCQSRLAVSTARLQVLDLRGWKGQGRVGAVPDGIIERDRDGPTDINSGRKACMPLPVHAEK